MTIPMAAIELNICFVYWLWFLSCWVMSSTSPSSLLKLIIILLMVLLITSTVASSPLLRPQPPLVLEGLSVVAFSACFSLSCWMIFCSWTNKEFFNSSMESSSISFDSSIEKTTKIKFLCHWSKDFLNNGDILHLLSMDSHLACNCHSSWKEICNCLSWLHT